MKPRQSAPTGIPVPHMHTSLLLLLLVANADFFQYPVSLLLFPFFLSPLLLNRFFYTVTQSLLPKPPALFFAAHLTAALEERPLLSHKPESLQIEMAYFLSFSSAFQSAKHPTENSAGFLPQLLRLPQQSVSTVIVV